VKWRPGNRKEVKELVARSPSDGRVKQVFSRDGCQQEGAGIREG
jgi:hypothetical protein